MNRPSSLGRGEFLQLHPLFNNFSFDKFCWYEKWCLSITAPEYSPMGIGASAPTLN